MFASEPDDTGVPQGLEAIPPGPRLAVLLSTLDVDRLSGPDAIRFAKAQQRQIAHDQARHYRAMCRIGDLYAHMEGEDLREFASAEIAAALTLTRRCADREMSLAFDLRHRYPMLLTALEAGIVDIGKVWVILRGVGHIDRAAATSVIERVLPDAPGLTTGQLASLLRRLVIEVDPHTTRREYLAGVEARRVWSELAPDGTGTMIATGMPSHDLSAANRHINGIARRLKNHGDGRTMDQIRCDVYSSLLTGATHGSGGKAEINLTASLATLSGLAEHPGELAGLGPVIADVARDVARQQRHSTWTYTVTDTETGDVYVGTTRRRPSLGQQRRLTARYPTCVHPGCRMPSRSCDLDHTEDWARGGPTTLYNLAPLCRFHHRLKHQGNWNYSKRDDGTIDWRSRFGHHYATHPP